MYTYFVSKGRVCYKHNCNRSCGLICKGEERGLSYLNPIVGDNFRVFYYLATFFKEQPSVKHTRS